ncbi:hypothetical protein [Nonlabens sp.]|uniref:hypothetical protein n=1 Tax=Nonlabens sp. TaxID=1888209 RepID=UPI0025F58276|nr:hypothetical protein [Nonlabens sp.]
MCKKCNDTGLISTVVRTQRGIEHITKDCDCGKKPNPKKAIEKLNGITRNKKR